MASVANSLFDRNSRQFEEIIALGMMQFMPALDPVFAKMFATQRGVVPVDQLGRGYEIRRVYHVQSGGVIDGALATNEFGLYGDANTTLLGRMFQQSYVNTFPDPTQGANYIPFTLRVGLRGNHASIAFSLAELRAEATPTILDEIVKPKLVGFSRQNAQRVVNAWYVNQNNGYALCKISGYVLSGTGPYYLTFQPDNGACHRFMTGDHVDIYSVSSSAPSIRKNDSQAAVANQTVNTRINLLVHSVDEMTNTVRLVSDIDPASAWLGAGAVPANGDFVLMRNSRITGATTTGTSGGFTNFAGLASWMKFGTGTSGIRDDNQLLGKEALGTVDDGIIDVTQHPEFKSFLYNVNGVATEQVLRRLLSRFHSAKNRYGQSIDTLIASDGVWLAYESQKIGREIIDRTNRLSSLRNEGSDNVWKFTFDGRTYEPTTSMYVESGTMIGTKTGNKNWKIITPPDPKGTKAMPGQEGFSPLKMVTEVLTGGNSVMPIMRTVNNISLPTEGTQQVGLVYMQVVPDQPAGLKLTGLTEDKVYADTSYSGV